MIFFLNLLSVAADGDDVDFDTITAGRSLD